MSVAAPAGRPNPLTLMMQQQQQQPYLGSSSSSSGYGGYGGGASSRAPGAASSSGDGGEEGEAEEEEEEEEAGRMLGFMFGNVDDTGDLDVEYLDQEAKEHLSALADQLGPSLVDLEFSAKAKQLSVSASLADQEDYDQKADDAVDYEDIDEACEDDGQMLPDEGRSNYYAQVALATTSKPPQAEEENYDEEEEEQQKEEEDDEEDEEEIVVEPVPVICQSDLLVPPKPASIPAVASSEKLSVPPPASVPEKLPAAAEVCVQNFDADSCIDTADDEWDDDDDDFDFDDEPVEEYSGDDDEAPEFQLPVIYEEHGKQVLQFSEIFGAKQEFWRLGNKKVRSKRSLYRGMSGRYGKYEALVDADEAPELKVVPDDYDFAEFHLLESDEREVQQLLDGADEELAGRFKQLGCEPLNRKLPEIPLRGGAFSANFDPVHQLEWEQGIIWDVEARRIQDDDSESSESAERPRRTPAEPARSTGSGNEKMIVLEPLSRQVSIEKSSRLIMRHPQFLRLESCRVQQPGSEALKKIERLLNEGDARNLELASGAWLDDVCWDQEKKARHWMATLDLTDSHMVFEVAEARETKVIRDHAAAMVISPRSGKGKTPDISELNVPSRFNISNDKYYTAKKSTQQQKMQTKKRVVHGSVKVVHSVPALRLQTMKPKLTNKDLANFHRPKATWFPHHNEVAAKEQGVVAVRGPMKVIVKSLGGKGSKVHADASDTLETFYSKIVKKLGDLKPSERVRVIFAGKELQEGKTLAEQKVPPNSVLHLIRSKVHIWKPQRLPGENKPTRPPGAFKKKSELSVKDGHVALMEYCEERPLILSNPGMGSVLSTYYRKRAPADVEGVVAAKGPWTGVILPLEPAEESPFLGNILLGEKQSCLETNMYRAPVFRHRVRSTDFLLVRSPKGKLSLRRIDNIHVVGQQEPHIEVIAPQSKTVLNYLGNRLMAHVYREFRSKERPGVFPQIAADELSAHFPALNDSFVRKRLKNVADLQRGASGDLRWVMRRGFRVPSEEELRRMVTPENVCSYESMQAGQHHLKRLGIHRLTQHNNLPAATNELPDEAITLAAATHIERELQVTPWNLSSNFVSAIMQGRSVEKLEIAGTGDPTGRGLGFSYLRMALRPANTGAIVEKKAAAARGGGAVTGTDADLRRLSMEAAREVLLKFKVSEAEIEKLTRWHRIALVRKLSSEQAVAGGADVKMNLNKYARGNNKMPAVHQQQQVKAKCQEIWDRQAASLSAVENEASESDEDGNVAGDLDDFAGDLENLLEAEEDEAKDVQTKKDKRENIRGFGRRKALQAQMEEDMEDEAAEAAELHRMLMEDDEAEEEQKRKAAMNQKNGPATPGTPQVQTPAPAPAPASVVTTPLPVVQPSIAQPGFVQPGIVQPGILQPGFVQPGMVQPSSVPPSNGQTSNGQTSNGQTNRPKLKKRVLKRTFNRRNDDGTITKEVQIINDPVEVEKYLAKKRERDAQAAKNNAGKSSQKKVPVKDLKERKAMNPMNKNAGAKARDTKLVICGGCGQVGHMRTNKKKCPLYSGGGAGTPAPRPEPEVLDRPLPKLTIKKPVLETPKLRVRFTSLEALAGKEAPTPTPTPAPAPAPAPPQAPEPKPAPATTNGHQGRVLKIKIVKPKHNPDVETERIHQKVPERLEFGGESEAASEMVRNVETSPEIEQIMLQQQQEQQQQQRQQQHPVESRQEESEKKRQPERPEETHKKKKKHKKDHKKERQKEKISEDLERKLEEKRVQEERERLRQIQLQEQQQLQQQQQQRRAVEPKRSIVIKHKKRPPPTHQESPEPAKRQRKRGGEVEIANILEDVVEKMRQADCSYLFLKPVTKKEAPDYHFYIKKPMDLSTIRDRIRRLQYKSREDFLTDVQLIVDNAHTYNDNRNPGIPPLADRLYEVCEELLEQRELQLSEIEERIEEEEQLGIGTTTTTAPTTTTGGGGRKRSLKTL